MLEARKQIPLAFQPRSQCSSALLPSPIFCDRTHGFGIFFQGRKEGKEGKEKLKEGEVRLHFPPPPFLINLYSKRRGGRELHCKHNESLRPSYNPFSYSSLTLSRPSPFFYLPPRPEIAKRGGILLSSLQEKGC